MRFHDKLAPRAAEMAPGRTHLGHLRVQEDKTCVAQTRSLGPGPATPSLALLEPSKPRGESKIKAYCQTPLRSWFCLLRDLSWQRLTDTGRNVHHLRECREGTKAGLGSQPCPPPHAEGSRLLLSPTPTMLST